MYVSENERESWYSDLTPGPDEPLFWSLVKYRMSEDRWPDENGNLLSSKLKGSKLHAPIIDLDGFHRLVFSRTLLIEIPQQKSPNMAVRVRAKLGVLLLHGVWRWLYGARVYESSSI